MMTTPLPLQDDERLALKAARELLDELNLSAASGLITRQALILMGQLQLALSKVGL